MRRLRIIGLSLLALGVPAFAFGGEQAPSGGSLSVSASLGGCGLANAAIVCQIDASWSAFEGAEYYTVSVTRADGSVVDVGQGAGTSRSIFVPYVGPGTYSVQVSAWGTPPGEDEAEVLAREKSMSTADAGSAGGGGGDVGTNPAGSPPPGEEGDTGEVAEEPAGEDDPATEPPVVEPPVCEEEPPEEPVEPDAEAAAEPGAETVDPLAPEDDPEIPPCP
jgi:hypothetical protein